jgi:hypothetical protein
MSAPYIRVPQSCPVSGRARDCLDEFNRVAADPKLGASLEQLQEGRRTMELTARPADTLIEYAVLPCLHAPVDTDEPLPDRIWWRGLSMTIKLSGTSCSKTTFAGIT